MRLYLSSKPKGGLFVSDPGIYLAFRFHVNFYHSYRGDTPDELGFGKDVRIIRKIIQVLDRFNADGIPARGTWDIENYFSLEKIMPEHCPDIIAALQRRVAQGQDEVQVMSYNNGLISAHTAAEFDEAIAKAISNDAGSGLRDVFGAFFPMVRPQEMMYTPLHLKLYQQHGIEHISLFYSAVPFNAFSNFVAPLPFEQRYNPLTLTYPGVEETMTLLPAYNHGDIADNISLRWWLKRLRRKQLSMSAPKDLLLLLDADADDDYWWGYDWPVVSRLLAATRGLRGLIESVCDLDFVTFTTPGGYVKTHPPLGVVSIGQDTADGSFDGLACWAEKWSNHWLWTGVERARILELQTRRLVGISNERPEIDALVRESRRARLRALSTTHFGLASPVMNRTRLQAAQNFVHTSVEKASRAFELAVKSTFEASESVEFALLDYVRGIPTASVAYEAKPSQALVSIPLSVPDLPTTGVRLLDAVGKVRPACIRLIGNEDGEANAELLFVENVEGGERKDYRLDLSAGPEQGFVVQKPVSLEKGLLENEFITLRFNGAMQVVGFACRGIEMSDGSFLRSAINYAGRVVEVLRWRVLEREVLGNGLLGYVKVKGEIPFKADGEKRVDVEREYTLASGLPYLYVNTRIIYPQTRSNNYNKNRARQLEGEYDGNWREVMPCEIRPALFGQRDKPLRVWKHNYLGHVSHYDLNYGTFSKNEELDSFNNHVTHAWVAVTDGDTGLLVAQTANVNACFAFCPMRTRATSQGARVFLNPFGCYHGKQLRYATAFSGLGRFIAVKMADSLDSFAPSFNGRTERLAQLIAPYTGDAPPQEIRSDAEAFAYPYAVVSRSKVVTSPLLLTNRLSHPTTRGPSLSTR
jgi:hypothetical protein